MTSDFILRELHSIADPVKAKFLQGFFKTGKGQYAEGDVFLGITMPLVRDMVKHNKGIPMPEIEKLLHSEFHEARMAALLFLVQNFKKTKDEQTKKIIFDFYLSHTSVINNWDLVDITCRDIVGGYLLDKKDRNILYWLAESSNLWEQRIAIISTWIFIKDKQFSDTLKLSEKLMNHRHDLMHKAVGWMLREVGKKDKDTLVVFLEKHYQNMPRTALRYAIEHFSADERAYFMKK